MCNIDIFKEGVDLPVVDMIVFCDPKYSPISII